MTPGFRLGPYEIIGSLGAGGMGEVYRAADTNLKRQVAIKVLPASVATDEDRLARFQREAEVLAALNHPNIAHIFGVEKAGGTLALVMELVEGRRLPIVSRRVLFRSMKRFQSRGRSPTRSNRHTSRASSIATSSPRTSSFAMTAPSRCWILDSPKRSIRTRDSRMQARDRR